MSLFKGTPIMIEIEEGPMKLHGSKLSGKFPFWSVSSFNLNSLSENFYSSEEILCFVKAGQSVTCWNML